MLRRFERGLIDLRRRNQLYAEDPRGVEISEGVLYRARISIPARVPVGTYTAETFLIRDGRVIAGAAREIRIEKLGFERFVADAAERWSLTYGLVRGGAVAAARLGRERRSSSRRYALKRPSTASRQREISCLPSCSRRSAPATQGRRA